MRYINNVSTMFHKFFLPISGGDRIRNEIDREEVREKSLHRVDMNRLLMVWTY